MAVVQEAVRTRTRIRTSQMVSIIGVFAFIAFAVVAVAIKQQAPLAVSIQACSSFDGASVDCSVLVQNTGLTTLKNVSVQLNTGTSQATSKSVAGASFSITALAGNDSILQHVSFSQPTGFTPSKQTAMFAVASSGQHMVQSATRSVSAQSFNPNFLTTATITDASQMAISGNTIAFSDNVYNNGGDIYLYDLVTHVRTQVTQDGASRDVDIDGAKVVYVSTLDGEYTVELYDTASKLTSVVSTGAQEKRYPKISGDYVVWQDARSGVSQVFAYNLQTHAETLLYDDPQKYNQTFPDIDGDSIVWVENGVHVALYSISAATRTLVVADNSIRIMPHVFGNNIVWVQWGGLSNAGTYVYNIPTASLAALSLAGTTTSYSPVISGNRIVRTVAQTTNVLDFYVDDLGDNAVYGGTCNDDLTNVALTTDHYITNQAWPAISGYTLIYLGPNGLYKIDTNFPPVINQNAEQVVTIGQTTSFAVTATDQDIRTCGGNTNKGDGNIDLQSTKIGGVQSLSTGGGHNKIPPQPILPHVNYTAQYVPPGALFTDNGDNTATFSWTPVAGQEGVYDVPTFTATDDGGLTSSETVKITVQGTNQPPTFVTIGAKTVYVDEPLSFAVAASDPEGDPLTYGAQQLPTGAQFSGSTFSWVPGADQVGDHVSTFTVTDGVTTVSTQVTVTVQAQPVADVNAPVIVGPGGQTINEGQTLTIPITATDPLGVALVLSVSNQPFGATFTDNGNGNGTFSWSPTYDQSGQYTVTFLASNGTLIGWKTVMVTVGGVNRSPVLDSIGNKTIRAGQSLVFTIFGRDLDSDLVTFSVNGAPTGSALTKQTFSWVPTADQVGTYNVAFSVTDGTLTASETITITVQGAPQEPPTIPGTGGGFTSQAFTAFPTVLRNGFSVASGKLRKSTDDPRAAVVVGAGQGMQPQVKIFTSDGKLLKSFYAYEKTFLGGVRVAVCDLNGDGVDEILTAPGPGYRPYIREFNASGKQVLWKQIWALDGKTKNGLNIACGDINGDDKAEIIAASDVGSGHMTIHMAKGSRIGNVWPYGHAWRGGVVLAVLDDRGTGVVDIVAATETGASQVRLLNEHGKRVGPTILPYSAGTKNGLLISAGDVNGDRIGELIVSQLNGTTSRIRMYGQAGAQLLTNFLAYPKTVAGGARTAVGDIEASGGSQAIISVPARNAPAQIRFFDATGASLN